MNDIDYPEPTEKDLQNPEFEAVWQAIKAWDINQKRCNARVLLALRPIVQAAITQAVEADRIERGIYSDGNAQASEPTPTERERARILGSNLPLNEKVDALIAASGAGQEWTVEPCVGSISGQQWPGLSYIRVGNHTMGSVNTEVAKQIMTAHNATLRDSGDTKRLMRELVGWLSGDIAELHSVEVPRLSESLDRFLNAAMKEGKP